MSADEYVRMPIVNKSFGAQVVLRLPRIICPVTAPTESDVGHQNFHSLTIKTLECWVVMSYVLAVTISVDSDQRLERSDLRRALNGTEIPRMPNLVNRFQKFPHVISEHSMSVGNKSYKHFRLQFNNDLLLV